MATGKKASNVALAKWDQKFAPLAKEAADQVKNVGGGGTAVKFGRGSISVGGATVPGGKLECIILGSCALNAWWSIDYDADNVQPPDCYAFAIVSGDPEMVPHAEAADKQSDKCADCGKNQFGTSKRGRGKACSNCIKLALITANDASDADGVASAEIAIGRVSPTNLKHWAGYVKSLAQEDGRPPWAVVTQIQTFDDPDTQIRVQFTKVETIDDPAILEALEKRIGEDGSKIQEFLQQPYGPAVEKKVPKAKAGANRKFAAGRNAGGRR